MPRKICETILRKLSSESLKEDSKDNTISLNDSVNISLCRKIVGEGIIAQISSKESNGEWSVLPLKANK